MLFGRKKLISFVVPCYNSQSYMERCINTLLKGENDVEIIIVNDGSTDNTLKIANGYKKRYPKIIKVIDKKNGGHGSGVNAGLKVACGKYFKVVDSDDWLDEAALIKLIKRIKKLEEQGKNVDVFITNYIYDHLYDGYKKVMKYDSVFFENQVSTWDQIAPFKQSQYLIMHSLMYKTKILKDCKLKLPEHTFYVDNLVAFIPLIHTNNLYYMNIDLYHYFIGREDQSVNESVMMSRIDQQIKVTKLLIESFDMDKADEKSEKLKNYMIKFLSMMVTICNVYLLMINDEDALEKRDKLWEYIDNHDHRLYKELKKGLSGITYRKTKLGNFISLTGYKIAKKIFKFN